MKEDRQKSMTFRQRLRHKQISYVIVDFSMIGLLLLNLAVISVDWIIQLPLVNAVLAENWPDFFDFYQQTIHAHFLEIDLVFVALFLLEFTISWAVAIRRRTYYRWFFYPFIHWYDLLGCIPLNAFRLVRFLRVISIVYRLHQLKIINLRSTYLFIKAKKYYGILLEEISDRVVANLIVSAQAELGQAGSTLDSIINDVLRPKQRQIVDWLSKRLETAAMHNFDGRKREIRLYVESSIADAFRKNDDIKKIEQIPMVGKTLCTTLERSISSIVYNIIENAMRDLASSRNRLIVEEATDIVFGAIEAKDQDNELHAIILETLIEALEKVKEQVTGVKRWKLADLA